jgi:hypothetical protein
MTKGRKMEPRPSSTKGSLSFSSGAMDSKSLAKNSSGSLALVRGLRSFGLGVCRRVDGAPSRRRLVAAASMACDGGATASRVGASMACDVAAPRVGARETSTERSDAGPRFWSGSC